jgi:hypothetical protein
MTNIQTIFNLCPHVLNHVLGYCSHSIPYASLQLLKIIVFDLVDEVKNQQILDAWKMDEQSANCLAPQVTRFNPTGLFLQDYVNNIVSWVNNNNLQ